MAKQDKLRFLIIDDDRLSAEIHKNILESAGHEVDITTSSALALSKVTSYKPDCVLCDLLMPELDGLDVFQQIKASQDIKQPIFIVVTGKTFEFDRRRAFEMGVDGYLTKPVNSATLVSDVLEIINHTMTIQFWGVRGTLPVPGIETVRYGGNTNCVTLSFAKKNFFIFDAGTGIKALSNSLVKQNRFPMSAKIFISHPHYDHINGIPFFVPLYMKGNEFEIFGAGHGDNGIEALISDQMDSIYFPITIKEFAANLSFHDLKEESFTIDNLTIQTLLLNHPGRCLGYRVQYENKSFCYITDNELYLNDSPHYNQFEVDRLIQFVHDTDVLVIDTTYTDEQYLKKVDWGHSCVSQVVHIADKANVKTLCLYHHDPDQVDDDIDDKLEQARSLLKSRGSKVRCIAPAEGEKIII